MLELQWWLGRIWAAPYTFMGVSIGCVALLTGGHMRRHTGVLEIHGGAAARFLDLLPLPQVAAMTLGHSVIGRDPQALEFTRPRASACGAVRTLGAVDGAGLSGVLRRALAAGP